MEEKVFIAQGYVTVPVLIKLKAISLEVATEEVETMINSENTYLQELELSTINKKKYIMTVVDSPEVDWESVVEEIN